MIFSWNGLEVEIVFALPIGSASTYHREIALLTTAALTHLRDSRQIPATPTTSRSTGSTVAQQLIFDFTPPQETS